MPAAHPLRSLPRLRLVQLWVGVIAGLITIAKYAFEFWRALV